MLSKEFLGLLLTLLSVHLHFASAAVPVSAPSAPKDGHVVYGNFLGISIELSFLNQYFGNDTNSVPAPIVNYLTAYRSLLSDVPLRVRIGGNSMDSSQFVQDQTDIMTFTDPNANSNDQPVKYGPTVFNVMNKVTSDVGGVEYLVGLSLREPNNTMIPQLAVSAQQILGDNLDAFLLGNEPDLYTSHGNRPNLANYSVFDYVGDYWTVLNALGSSSAGNITALDKIAGPTICCRWDLATTVSQWLATFQTVVKYITLQHYPKNNCGMGAPDPELPYYLDHSNVVDLAKWQSSGIKLANQAGKPVIMSEFSTASCGGFPGVSDAFGAGTLWSADYAFQMAANGYSAAYMHTRERGTTYNLFDYPAGDGKWFTNPTYYSYFPVLEALQSHNGSTVVDLNVDNSMTTNSTSAGYGIYDYSTKDLYRVVLFNYANGTGAADYAVPKGLLPTTGHNITVKYLTAPSVNEKVAISWSGTTWNGVGDGKAVNSRVDPDLSLDCSGGCVVSIPSPGLAVLAVEKDLPKDEPSGSSNNGGQNGGGSSDGSGAVRSGVSALSFMFTLGVPLIINHLYF